MTKTVLALGVIALAVALLVTLGREPGTSVDEPAEGPQTPAAVEARAARIEPRSVERREVIAEGAEAAPSSVASPTLRGHVVDEQGGALAGVEVVLGRRIPAGEFDDPATFLRHRSFGVPLRLAPNRIQRTDGEGAFRFEDALAEQDSVIAAWAFDRGARFAELPPDARTDIVIVLADHSQILGRVVDETGFGVPHESVSCHPADGGGTSSTTRTDADGRFRTIAMPPGRYRVTVRTPQHFDAAMEVALDRHDVRVEIGLKSLPMLSMLLVDADELPWSGTRIQTICGIDPTELEVHATRLSCARRADVADAPGRVTRLEFEITTGSCRGPIRDPSELAFLSVWWREARLAEVPIPSLDVGRIVVALRPPALASIRVRLAFEPHPDGPVRTALALDRPSRDWAAVLDNELRTTIEGFETTLTVPASDGATLWWLTATAPGHAVSDVPFTLPAGTEPTLVDIVLRRAARTLEGLVVAADGTPVVNASIVAIAADGSFVARRESVSARSDHNGAFRIPSLPMRSLRLLVERNAQQVAVHDVPEDLVEPVRIVLQPATRLFVESPFDGMAQFVVLDAAGRTLLDDRIQGAVRPGSGMPLFFAGRPSRVIGYAPASPTPFAQGDCLSDATTVTLSAIPATGR